MVSATNFQMVQQKIIHIMCVYICVYIYVCVCVYMYIITYVCIHKHTDIHMHIHREKANWTNVNN